MAQRSCLRCERSFEDPPAGRGRWTRYCSETCKAAAAEAMSSTTRQLRPGERVPTTKPRRYLTVQGYIRLRWRVGSKRYVETPEHRVFDGRVTTAEHVHHIDHDRTNNDPSNLECMTAEEHMLHHADLHRRLDPQHAIRLYQEGMSQTEVAAAVGCNGATISRLLRSHGVPTRSAAKQYPWPEHAALLHAVAQSTSAVEVAERLALPVSTIRAAMAHHQIPSFPPGRRKAA